ncbi:MAG: protein kinase [Anaerolineales bacterium]|jgi:uncharacterized membrane protein|nr:protein kinase [Anaerolineales bacterium]
MPDGLAYTSQPTFHMAEALSIAAQVAEGLGCLHEQDIIHRDLHPGNILFTAKNVAKIADLGLAQVPPISSSLIPQHPGNPAYHPPEAIAKSNVPVLPLNPNADVYMLGAVLWEMLTGRLYYHKKGTSPSELNAQVPAWLDELVMGMLVTNPASRPRDGEGAAWLMKEALERIRKENKQYLDKVARQTQLETKRVHNQSQQRKRSSAKLLILLALIVMLFLGLVTAGGMAYRKWGRTQQYNSYYQEAVLLAAQAELLTDPNLQRNTWNRVLEQVDKAEYYTVTTESQALRSQANAVLDWLDGVQRLDFHPALIGGLGDSVRVTRMIASEIYLYMLNATLGAVYLGVQVPNGYEINPNFQCGPTFGMITVGPLIDITDVPTGTDIDADLIGMDSNGNLIYCTPFEDPTAHSLAHPPAGLWQPSALTIDQGNLYVLDPKANAVWVYYDLNIEDPPQFFFGNDMPPMQDVIDLVVYNDELYLLHSDGHLTHCTNGYLTAAPTACQEPYAFTDTRLGLEGEERTLESLFSQVSYVAFPDRSMYMLDPQNQAAYYFSVQFKLQTQYRPVAALGEGQATAFAVNAERRIFLAFSNSIYYAALP